MDAAVAAAAALTVVEPTSNGDSFYTGDIARRIDAESRKFGGYLRKVRGLSHGAVTSPFRYSGCL